MEFLRSITVNINRGDFSVVFCGTARGYWRVGFAVVGWLTLSGASPPKTETALNKQSDVQRDYSVELGRIATTLERDQSERQDGGCLAGKDDRRSDLCAQWKAADAAYDSMRIAFAGAVAGFATLFFAYRAAHWAKQAAVHAETGITEAKRAADAGENAVAETKRIGEAQSRAYLDLNGIIAEKEDGLVRFIKLTVKNFGQTPAINVLIKESYSFRIKDVNHPGQNEQEFPLGIIAPGDEAVCYISLRLDEESSRLFDNRELKVCMKIEIDYDDVFLGKHGIASDHYSTFEGMFAVENGTRVGT